MTYRLYSKAVDLDASKARYAIKLEETIEAFEQAGKALQIAKDRGEDAESIRFLTTEVNKYQRRIDHLNEQIEYMEFYSGTDVVMDVTQDYIFDWTYVPGADKLTPGEVFSRAKRELNAIASQKIDALSVSGVKGRLCTQDEMIDMLRRHSKPLSAELYKQRMVNSSSFEEDIVSSDSIDEVLELRKREIFQNLSTAATVEENSGKGVEYDDEE